MSCSQEQAPGSLRVSDAFTLIELLVVLAVIAVLASLLLPALSRAKETARATQCLGQLREIWLGVKLYADASNDEFPRSQHSAFAYGQLPWGRAIAVELGQKEGRWTNLLASLYHCPSDRRPATWSYGQNVYFELNPDTDDYAGSPQTWRKMPAVPRPSATVLQAENATGADHIMAHFWTGPNDTPDVDPCRHRSRSNYSFVDGHAQAREFRSTYAPDSQIDLWNPCLAR